MVMSEPEVPSILLAEDNPADVMLVEQALKEHAITCKLRVLRDGAEALRFFRDLDDDSKSRAPDRLPTPPQDRADAESHSARYFRKPAGLDAFRELGTVIKQAIAGERRERCS